MPNVTEILGYASAQAEPDWDGIISSWDVRIGDCTGFDSGDVFGDNELGLYNLVQLVQTGSSTANQSAADNSTTTSFAERVGVITKSRSPYKTWEIVCLATIVALQVYSLIQFHFVGFSAFAAMQRQAQDVLHELFLCRELA